MDTISITHPAPTTTRETVTQKALRLYPERTIEPLAHGRYSVEGSEVAYVVDLGIDGGHESCPCLATKPCYHIALATIYRAKARIAARRVQAGTRTRRTTRRPFTRPGASPRRAARRAHS